ncbi:MAG: AAA family ATPase, partial [Dictyoglomus sp.]
MKPFSMIAIPHRDIIEGRLTMEVFAADLWEVFKGRAPEEYQNSEEFFRRTHRTYGLENLFAIAKNRLQGKGGDPVIQLQTPFGGGKTHSLIALYHKAKEWNAKVVVFSGDKFSVGEQEPSLWEEIERQLEGEPKKLKGFITPGGEKIRELLSE